MSEDEDIGVNRCRSARERAGLSAAQAQKLLGLTEFELSIIEHAHPDHVRRADELADCYGVSVEWLLGEVPMRDYAAVRAMKGAENISFHDRDEVAMLAASLPRRKS